MKQAYHRSGLWINESQPGTTCARPSLLWCGKPSGQALAFLDPKVVGAGAAWMDTLAILARLSTVRASSGDRGVTLRRHSVPGWTAIVPRVRSSAQPVSSPAAGSYNLRTPYSGPDGAAVTDVQLKSGGVQPNSPAPYRARVKRERPPRPGHHDTHPYTERTTAKARRGIFQPCLRSTSFLPAGLTAGLDTGLDSRLDSTV